ncbi:MAG TPA: class I SAM-dependent methyltransferase [Longimicrobiaceae bacterium]|nr:class I SAM-dependent methyltransferase [Longimicrobiaceae bacterium]
MTGPQANPDPTQRFSDRVANYVRYRPGYPVGILQTLRAETGLSPVSIVADLGSGTGISAELFLREGCTVYAVEPNAEMRAAAEARLGGYPGFHSLAGTAEATRFPDRSVDLVTAGQAFHWFDLPRTRVECLRILRPGGWAALFWNVRRTGSTPFLRTYEELLLTYGTDYAQVRHDNIGPDALGEFFGPGGYRTAVFPNEQSFDLEGLKGRTLSASYTPAPGHPNHAPMLEALTRIFHAHQEEGRVRFEYDTEMLYGQPAIE